MVAATFALTDCTKDYVEAPADNQEFTVLADASMTKTVNDGMDTKWAKNDSIAVMHAAAGSAEYVMNKKFTTTAADGVFKGTLESELETGKPYDWYAIYPYKSQFSSPANTSAYLYIGGRSDRPQVQKGNDNTAHLAGVNLPMVAKAKAVPSSEVPVLHFSHVSSVVAFNVKNALSEPLVINSISFEAPEPVAGSYYIAFDGDDITYTPSGDTYVTTTPVLNVTGATEIPVGGSAVFYMVVKPFTVAANDLLTITVSGETMTGEGTHEMNITKATPVTFSAGKIKTVNVTYDTPVTPVAESNYVLVTGLDQITDGEYVIANGNYLLPNTPATASSPVAVAISQKAVLDGSILKTRKADVKWNFTVSGTDVTIKSAADESYILNATNANAGVRVSDTKDTWAFSVNGDGFSMKDKNNGRYCAVYGAGPDWRSYTSATHANYVDKGIVNLYKLTEGSLKQNQELSFPEESYEVRLGDSFATPALSGAKTAVTYSSDNTDVAAVDAGSGAVTIVSNGTVTITATAAETSEYYGASASYVIVIKKDGLASVRDIASSIPETAKKAAEAEELSATLANAVVTYVNGKNAYIEDATGAIALYAEDHGFVAGDVISGKVVVKAYLNAGTPNLASIDMTEATKTAGGVLPLTTLTLAELSADMAKYLSMRIKIEDVDVTKSCFGTAVTAERQGEISQGSARMMLFSQVKEGISIPAGSKGQVIGYPTLYNDTMEFCIWQQSDFTPTIMGGLITFEAASVEVVAGETVTNPASINSGAAVTYSSSDTSVATVDPSTGVVTGVAAGTATITAAAQAVEGFTEASAEFSVKVNPAGAKVVAFSNLGFASWGKTASFSGSTFDVVSQSKDGVTFTYRKKDGSTYANTTAIRFYKSNELVFEAPEGYKIVSISWDGSSFKDDVTTDVPTCTSSTSALSWSGDAASVTFTRPSGASSYATLSAVTVTLQKQ